MTNRNPELFLSREELLRLAALEGVSGLVGLEVAPEEMVNAQSPNKELDRQLTGKGILKGKNILADQRATLQTLLKPERALIVVRDRIDIGKQVLIFLFRNKLCLLHSFPKEHQHRIAIIHPDEIEDLLNEWFPVQDGSTNDAILLTEKQLSDLISITNKGETPPPLPNIDSAQSQKLIHSLLNRKWSASFLLLELQNGQAVNADSFSAWSGDGVEWVVDLHSPEVLRLRPGGDHFVGLRRMILRKFAQFDKIVRAYRLSTDELAFALMTLNRRDIAERLLQLSSLQNSEKRMEDASKILHVRGLSETSPKGFPTLADDFEQALTPMVIPTRIGRIRTASSRGISEGTLYLLKNRSFCAHYVQKDAHVIEGGKWEQLPAYMTTLFEGFGRQKTKQSEPVSISLKVLTEMLDEKEAASIEKRLLQQGLPKEFSAGVAVDIAHPTYRASIIGINPSREDSSKDEPCPTLLLLKGNKHDWIFSFPSEQGDALGTGMRANSKRLMTELAKILGINQE